MKSLTIAIFVPVLLALSVACDKKSEKTRPDEREPVIAVKRGHVTIARIHNPAGAAGAVTAGKDGKTRPLQKGEAVHGETVSVPAGMAAELVFDDGTSVQVNEGSSLRPGGAPDVSQIRGQIAVVRPAGATVPFVVDVDGSAFSVLTGRTTISAGPEGAALLVESGELLSMASNTYVGAGARLLLKDGQIVSADEDGADPSPGPEPTALIAGGPVPSSTLRRGIGTLEARDPRPDRDPAAVLRQDTLDMTEHLINVSIEEGVAVTAVEEAFTNRSDTTVEATYRFLLPSDARITRLALDVNGRIEEGEVLEKKQAARIFKAVVDDAVRPRDPALLEWEEGSSFRMKIYPIKPGETRRVFLSYMTPLTGARGYYRYVYPLSAGSGAPSAGRFSFQATIHATAPVSKVRTPLYAADIAVEDTTARISFETARTAPSGDIVITWQREPPPPVRAAMSTEPDGRSFALFLLNPEMARETSVDRRVVFVVDTSWGMTDELRALSADTLVDLLGGLGRGDRFNVLACDSGCTPLVDGFTAPDATTIRSVHDGLSALPPGGASNLLGAFAAAFEQLNDGAPGQVMYLGDGVATSGERDPAALLSLLSQLRPPRVSVHTVGIGPDVDAPLLLRLASSARGGNYNLSAGESAANASFHISRLLQEGGLRDVSVRVDSAAPSGLQFVAYPRRIGMIPEGKEVPVVAALQGPLPAGGVDAIVRLEGHDGADRPVARDFRVRLVPPSNRGHGFISRLFAGAHIDELQFGTAVPAELAARSKEIISTSRTFRVASRLTSWIVLENDRMYDLFGVERTDPRTGDGTPSYFAVGEEQDDGGSGFDESLSVAVPAGSMATGAGAGAPAVSAARAKSAPMAAKFESAKKSAADADDSFEAEARVAAPSPALDVQEEAAGAPLRVMSNEYYRPYVKTRTRVTISAAGTPGPAALEKARELTGRRDQNPLSRSAHRLLVRHLARLDDRDRALTAAIGWRDADPLSVDALVACAAELHRSARRDEAMRLYAAVAEIRPDDAGYHERLATAFRAMGRYSAAAGHYRALLPLQKDRREDATLNYLFSLAMAGQRSLLRLEAQAVLDTPAQRSLKPAVQSLVAGLDSGLLPEWPAAWTGGALTVRIDGVDRDLDILIIDPWGRPLSGLWQSGATVTSLLDSDGEQLQAAASVDGAYRIVVARTDDRGGPVSGRLFVRLKGEQKTLPFSLSGASAIIAVVELKTDHFKGIAAY